MISFRYHRFVGITLLLLFSGTVNADYKRVCYYANWAQYRPAVMQFNPENINPSLCTHIVYAFAKILPDTNSLGTTESNDDGLNGNYKKVTDLKLSTSGLKVLLAVGGWNQTSAAFSAVVSTDTRINAFCDNVIKYLRDRNFDGLNIDWQFPGENGGISTDNQRYTILVSRLRQKFDTEVANQTTKSKLILSASVSGNKQRIDNSYEVNNLAKDFDFVNIMAYDYQGNFSSAIDHPSPLYPRSKQQPPQSYTNADYAVRYWMSKGMPAQKIVLGIPFYGKAFQLKSQTLYKIGDPFTTSYDLPYYKVCSDSTSKPIYQFQYGFQQEQNASFAWDSAQWVGYETQKSIEIKANYIKDMNLSGAMVFEISQDDFNGQFCNEGNFPLLTKLKQVLQFSKDQCQAGTRVDSLTYTCIDCALDTYQDKISQPVCIPCPSGTLTKSTRSTGKQFCHPPCPAGQEFDYLDSQCKQCSMNYFKNTQSRFCTKCPQGQKTVQRGSEECVPLPSGEVIPQLDLMTYRITMQFTAKSCDRPELMTDALRAEARRQMKRLNRTWEGICNNVVCDNVDVSDAVTGCQSSGRRRRQTQIPIKMDLIFNSIPQELKLNTSTGSEEIRSTRNVLNDYFTDKTVFSTLIDIYGLIFQSVSNTNITIVCRQAGYVLTNTMCEPCPIGTAENFDKCVECAYGFYQDKTGMTGCTKCPKYKATTIRGATSINYCYLTCPKGTRVASDTCVECPVGYYQDQINATTCNSCPLYYTTSQNGSTSFSDCLLKCPAGMKEESFTCVPCPLGEYQDQTGSKTCKSCPPNMTTNVTGAISTTQCFSVQVVCPVGQYKVSGSCVLCQQNFYQDLTGQTSCKSCPQFHITNILGASSINQFTCPKGTRVVSDTCVECPVGYYQDQINTTTCNMCPKYYTTNQNGSTSFSDCYLKCPAGMKEESFTCVPCPLGEYQDQIGSKTCKSCPPNMTTNITGAISTAQCFLQCPRGYKEQTGTCVLCPVGQYQDEIGSNYCKTCPAGKTTKTSGSVSASQCVSVQVVCPAGQYEVSGSCVLCQQNFYQDLTGQTSCKPCPQFHITNILGASSINQCTLHCPVGSKAQAGSCVACPVGQYQDVAGSTVCKDCPKFKTTASQGASSVNFCFLRCPTGTKEVSGTCELCPAGQYQDEEGQSTCKECPTSRTTNIVGAKSADQCILQCPAGFMQILQSCVECPLGQYQDEPGSSHCKSCPKYRTTLNSGSKSQTQCVLQCPAGMKQQLETCSYCPVGQYQNQLNATFCYKCPDFQTTIQTGSISITQCFVQCPAGYKQVSGTCQQCPVGQYQDGVGANACKSCPQYYTTTSQGATSSTQCILKCPVGYKQVSATCQQCPVGQYQDVVGAKTCKSCPQYYTTASQGATSSALCFIQCPIGYKAVSGTCQQCPAGQYQDGVGAKTCKSCPQYYTTSSQGATSSTQCFLQCPAGYKQVSGTCQQCPAGQYQDGVGANTCKSCPQYYTTSSQGATSSAQCFLRCPAGYREVSGTCQQCPVGQYQDGVGANACKSCPQYYTTSSQGATSSAQCFLQCPIGYKAVSGTCQQCPVGQYQDGVGANACKSCPQYYTTNSQGATSSTQCILQCPVGYKAVSGTCQQCPVGQYQDGIGANTCKSCPQYYTTNSQGATSSTQCFLQCPTGYKAVSGTCQQCPAGQYQDGVGAKTCKSCPQYYTTSSQGATSSTQCFLHCPVGRKQESGTCTECPRGWYQDETGKTLCKSCGPNKVTKQTGSTSQSQCILQCPLGTRIVSGRCEKCAVGQYQDEVNSTQCKQCPTFRTTLAEGTPSLAGCFWNCPKGMKHEGNSCELCPVGQYQDEIRSTVCKTCPEYTTTNTTGSTSLNECFPKCLAGTKGERGECVKCPRGQFQDEIGTTVCKACPEFRTTKNVGSKSLMDCYLYCPTGTKEQKATCVKCPAGQYQDEPNSTLCKECPQFTATSISGAISPDQCIAHCPAGYKEESGICVKCPLNYYQDKTESSSCKPCPQYKYTQFTGATSVVQCKLRCPAGTMQLQQQCQECPVDQYQDESGKTFCKNCPNNRRTNGTGASLLKHCLSPCEMSPDFCQNGGTCLWNESRPEDGMTCTCQTRFSGDHCENYAERADNLSAVIGGAVGGSLAFFLFLLLIVLACFCCRSSPKDKSGRIKNMDELSEGTYNPYFYMDGKYVVTQPATVVELVEPQETSSEFKKQSVKRSNDGSASRKSNSIYLKATSQLDKSYENKNAVMDMGNELEDNTQADINQYKFGLPYVGFMNVTNDNIDPVKVQDESEKAGKDSKGLYIRRIDI